MKSERGSVTLFVLVAMVFFLIIAMTAYVSASSKLQGQNEEIERIKASYEQNLDNDTLLQLYNNATKTREWLIGSGTQQDSYKIYKIEDLITFSIKSNSGDTFDGKYVELMNDLDFKQDYSYAKADRTDFGDLNGNGAVESLKTELTTGNGFPCIAKNSANAFHGTFLGDDHEIRNLYIYNNISDISIGLFVNAGNSTIQNLGISGNLTTNKKANIGGIVAIANSSKTVNINNCYNKSNITSTVPNYSIGGVVGCVNGVLNLNNSYNEGNISGGNNTGGLIGFSSSTANIENSYNAGNIINNIGGENAGGILGRDNAVANITTISKSYNIGNITGGKYIGGLIGHNNGTATISDCYNTADVTSIQLASPAYLGGMGGAQNQATITNCYNTGKITSQATSASSTICNGGIVGYLKGGTILKCYNTGKITQGNRVGGILGIAFGSNTDIQDVKIINSYNTGDVECLNLTSSSSSYNPQGAGIVDMAWYDNIYLLNCYNTGYINADTYASGMIRSANGGKAYVVNCYNQGNVKQTSNSTVAGILQTPASATIKIDNCYNKGTLDGTTKVGITRYSSGNTFNIKNTYYLNNVSIGIADLTPDPSTQMSQVQMTDQTLNPTFVETLNSNKNSINLADYDLSGYTISSWKQGTSGYPEFDW
ncbi:MAG: hypothetical protein IKF17_05045 [Clostridia bacterium]|nr:hypothetical protein [Clostridia bacterium]